MKLLFVALGLALGVASTTSAWAGTLKCPPDSAKVGNACIDLYEDSIWQIDPANTALLKKVQSGKVTLALLTGGGATQLAPAGTCSGPTDYGVGFPASGNWTPISGSNPPSPGIYAVSIPGVLPSACITWFQANQACLLSGKHLATNREWQGAAAGTPDPGTDDGSTDCNISTAGNPVNTGSRSKCKSGWSVFDMIGNVDEWVADWADRASVGCTNWTTQTGLPGSDFSCFGGNGSGGFNQIPGVLVRGGGWFFGTDAGVFAVHADFSPSDSFSHLGFRCAR